jgi:hypothetical protein
MAQTDLHLAHFVVSARRDNGLIQQTRKHPASAVVLALKWREKGYADVVVLDPSGRPVTPESYRREAMRRIKRDLSP